MAHFFIQRLSKTERRHKGGPWKQGLQLTPRSPPYSSPWSQLNTLVRGATSRNLGQTSRKVANSA